MSSRCRIMSLDTEAILHAGQALNVGRETRALVRIVGNSMVAVRCAVVGHVEDSPWVRSQVRPGSMGDVAVEEHDVALASRDGQQFEACHLLRGERLPFATDQPGLSG